MSESKIHILPIYGQMDPKTAIVHCCRRKSENHQVLSFQSGFRDLENDAAYFFKQNKQLTGKNQDSVPPPMSFIGFVVEDIR
jgi:hypothetical protein